MSDTSWPVIMHYGTNAERLAFTPVPPATGQPLYMWYETDTGSTFLYDTSWHQITGSGGAVTASGTLTANRLIIGGGTSVVSALGSLGTTTTLLHGNAAGAPTFGAVVEADITLADNTTNNVSTSAHGFMPKLPSGVPGVLLGYTVYGPATEGSKSTTSTTFADCDATNLVVAFSVPASGNVLVRLSAYADVSGGRKAYWNLRDSGGDIAGTSTFATATATGIRCNAVIVKTGLTPGDALSWKWGAGVSGGATFRTFWSDGTPSDETSTPAIMEVWAA